MGGNNKPQQQSGLPKPPNKKPAPKPNTANGGRAVKPQGGQKPFPKPAEPVKRSASSADLQTEPNKDSVRPRSSTNSSAELDKAPASHLKNSPNFIPDSLNSSYIPPSGVPISLNPPSLGDPLTISGAGVSQSQ